MKYTVLYTVQSHFFSLTELHTENSCRHSSCRDQQQDRGDCTIGWTSWGREGTPCLGAALEPQTLLLSQPLTSLTAKPGLAPTTPSSHQDIGNPAYRKGQCDSCRGKGAENPTEKDFQEKEHILFFWHLPLSADKSVLLNLPKQVSHPSSPSFPSSCLDYTHMDHIMHLIIPLENTLTWLWLAALFPCFLRVEMNVLYPYKSEGKQPESGGKCLLNTFPCHLGEWEDLSFSTSVLLL